jgi:beta-lactamase class A
MTVNSRQQLEERIVTIANRFTGQLGLAAKNLKTGEEVLHRADEMLPTASVIKLVVLIEAFAQAQEGKLRLDERMEVRGSDMVLGSGVLRDLAPGLNPTIHDIAMLMVIVSDNTATNMLIDRVGGVDVINRRIHESLGVGSVTLHNRIDFEKIGDDVRRLAESTPRGLATLMAMLVEGQVVNHSASEQMLQILGRQLYLDQVPRYLNTNPFWKELGLNGDFTVGAKTGFFPGTRADCGVVNTPAGSIVYAAMAHESSDRSMGFEAEPAVVNGLLGRLVVEYWWPEGAQRGAFLGTPYLQQYLIPDPALG